MKNAQKAAFKTGLLDMLDNDYYEAKRNRDLQVNNSASYSKMDIDEEIVLSTPEEKTVSDGQITLKAEKRLAETSPLHSADDDIIPGTPPSVSTVRTHFHSRQKKITDFILKK